MTAPTPDPSGRPVLAAPQLVVIGVGPAGRVMVPPTRQTLPLTTSMASFAVGTNSSRTALTIGTSVVTIRDTVG